MSPIEEYLAVYQERIDRNQHDKFDAVALNDIAKFLLDKCKHIEHRLYQDLGHAEEMNDRLERTIERLRDSLFTPEGSLVEEASPPQTDTSGDEEVPVPDSKQGAGYDPALARRRPPGIERSVEALDSVQEARLYQTDSPASE